MYSNFIYLSKNIAINEKVIKLRQKRIQRSANSGVRRTIFLVIFLIVAASAGLVGSAAAGWIQVDLAPVQQILSWIGVEDQEFQRAERTGEQAMVKDSTSQQTGEPAESSEDAPTPDQLRTLAVVAGNVNLSNERGNILQELNGLKLAARTVFSMEAWSEEIIERSHADYDQVLSEVSSIIYEAALRSGLEPVERYIHRALPTGVRPGFDVRYEYGLRDFAIYNPTDTDYYMQVSISGQEVRVSWSALPAEDWLLPEISISELERFPPKKILLIDHRNKTGMRQIEAGAEGLLIKIYRTIGGQQELIAKDYYPPSPEVFTIPPSAEVEDDS